MFPTPYSIYVTYYRPTTADTAIYPAILSRVNAIMHFPIVVGAVLAASLSTAQAADGCTQIGGNHYCNKVKSVTYDNFGSSGSYMDVTSFEGGTCSQESRSYSGPLAPMNEEVSCKSTTEQPTCADEYVALHASPWTRSSEAIRCLYPWLGS